MKWKGVIRVFTWWSDSFIYTENGGETWEWDEDGFWFTLHCEDSFIYCPDYVLAVGEFGTTARSYSFGEPWDEISHNWGAYDFIDVEFTSSMTGYAMYTAKPHTGLPAGYLHKTKDGGHSWEVKSPSVTIEKGSLCFINDQDGFLLSYDLLDGVLLYKTNDEGESWSEVYQFQVVPDLNEEEINLSFLDPLNGLATIHGYCFSTNDGGITWEQILNLSGMYQSFTHIEYLTLDSIFLSFWSNSYPVLVRSYDGGQSFEYDTITSEYGFIQKISFLDNSTGFAITKDYYDREGYIFKTTDGGLNWYETVLDDTLGAAFNDIEFTNSETGFAIGGNSSSKGYKTTDGGESWEKIEIPCSSPLKGLHFYDDWHGLVFGDNGVVMETFSGGIVGLPANPYVATSQTLTSYPNPATQHVTIDLPKTTNDPVFVEIFDLKGRMVKRKIIQVTSSSEIQLRLDDFDPGLYSCRIKIGSEIYHTKLIKQ